MNKWLYELLHDGTLLDNQEYRISRGVFSNHQIGQLTLKERKSRERRSVKNSNDKAFKFLASINYLLGSIDSNSLVLFNSKEYEHNTEDEFVNIRGYEWQNFILKTGNLIGDIKHGDYRIRISSRFGDEFLKYIIADADGFLEIENLGGNEESGSIYWLLLYLWKIQLKKAYRLGIPKMYEGKTERLTRVRGNIDVIDYFVNQKLGNYLCNYREHSYLNPISILVSEIFRLNLIGNFSEDIHYIQRAFNTASQGIRWPVNDLKKVDHVTNPYYSDYNQVIDLSKLLLSDQSLSIGDQKETSAFLFDVSMLFEYFIRKTLIRAGYSLRPKSEGVKIPKGSGMHELQPDLVIQTEQGIYLFDVKYKNFSKKYGVKREDLFQIHTYVGQYKNRNEIKGFGFIYPKVGESNEFIEQPSYIAGNEIPFYVCQLAVPELVESQYFSIHFKRSIDEFMNYFKEQIIL